jgi:hypothetical protein
VSRKPAYRASSKRNPKPHRRRASVQPSGQRGEPDQIALSTSGGGVHFAHRQGEDLGVRDDPPTGAPTSPQAREPKAEPFRPQAHSFEAERVHREAGELRLSVPDIGEQKLGEGQSQLPLVGKPRVIKQTHEVRGVTATARPPEDAMAAFGKSWRWE